MPRITLILPLVVRLSLRGIILVLRLLPLLIFLLFPLLFVLLFPFLFVLLLLLFLLLFPFLFGFLSGISIPLANQSGLGTYLLGIGGPKSALPIIILALLYLQLHIHDETQLWTVLKDRLPPLGVLPHLVLQLLATAA